MEIIAALTFLHQPIQLVLLSGNRRLLAFRVLHFFPTDLPNPVTEMLSLIFSIYHMEIHV